MNNTEKLRERYDSYLENKRNRENHKRLFCYGPPGTLRYLLMLIGLGTGKSRTAIEAIDLALEFGRKQDDERYNSFSYSIELLTL